MSEKGAGISDPALKGQPLTRVGKERQTSLFMNYPFLMGGHSTSSTGHRFLLDLKTPLGEEKNLRANEETLGILVY